LGAVPFVLLGHLFVGADAQESVRIGAQRHEGDARNDALQRGVQLMAGIVTVMFAAWAIGYVAGWKVRMIKAAFYAA
jgi:Na+/H+ antiporter NhaC